MKKIIFWILVLLALYQITQAKTNQLIFKFEKANIEFETKFKNELLGLINDYRHSKNISRLKTSDIFFGNIKDQTDYLIKTNSFNQSLRKKTDTSKVSIILGHSQEGIKRSAETWKILELNGLSTWSENLSYVITSAGDFSDEYVYIIANRVFRNWKNSDIHNQIMLGDTISKISVSVSISNLIVYVINGKEVKTNVRLIVSGATFFD